MEGLEVVSHDHKIKIRRFANGFFIFNLAFESHQRAISLKKYQNLYASGQTRKKE